MNFEPSQRSQEYLQKLKAFMQEHVFPFERDYIEYHKQNNADGNWQNWTGASTVRVFESQS